MKMEYVNVNGYLIPKLKNGPITDNTIGKYSMMRARYLDEHRPMERDQMLLDGTLAQHLTNIDCEGHIVKLKVLPKYWQRKPKSMKK